MLSFVMMHYTILFWIQLTFWKSNTILRPEKGVAPNQK